MKKFNVGIFQETRHVTAGWAGTRTVLLTTAYLRDYQPSWRGCLGVFEIEAENGAEAKKKAIALAKVAKLDTVKPGKFNGCAIICHPDYSPRQILCTGTPASGFNFANAVCMPAHLLRASQVEVIGTCWGCGAPAKFGQPCEYCGGLRRDQGHSDQGANR